MAKRKTRKIKALRLAADTARKPRTPLERARDERIAANRADWARLHPDKALAERALRKANISTRERWSHKRNGTAQTHEHATRIRDGALARLYMSGAIEAEQLAAGAEISAAAERIMRDVELSCASLETRVDGSRSDGAFYEALALVRLEVAYGAWRRAIGPAAPLVLAIVIEDIGIAAAARRHHRSSRVARRLLIDALDRWIDARERAWREIDDEALIAAQAAIL